MRGLGTLINTAAVILGGLLGMFFKKGLNKKVTDTLMQSCGLAVIFMGISGTLSKMLVFKNGVLETKGTMLLIFSLVFGAIIGEIIDLETKMDNIGEKIKKSVHINDSRFVDGFVNVSLIICVGAMAIIGSVTDGLTGDYTMLMAKSILDFIIVLVFASTYGIGVVFSSIPIFVYQGAITLLAMIFGSFINNSLISDLSFVGSVLIFCVGINITFGKKIKVGNILPALLIPIIYEIIVFIIH